MKGKNKRLMTHLLCIIMTILILTQLLSIAFAGAPSFQPKPSSNFSNLNLDEIFTNYSFQTTERPATFSTNYTLKEDVVVVDGKLGDVLRNLETIDELENQQRPFGLRQIDKLKETALIDHSLFSSKIPNYEKGKVYLDKVNGVAVKPTENVRYCKPGSATASSFVTLKSPAPNEIFKTFNIIRQQIKLTKGNISGFADKVEPCIIDRNQLQFENQLPNFEPQFPNYNTQSVTQLAYNGELSAGMLAAYKPSGSYQPKHLSNPWIELDFPNIPLAAYKEDGESVEVTVDGYLGIDEITVDAEYSFAGNYYFTINTAQESNLTINAEIIGHEELVVPIFGININAELACIRGCVCIVTTVDGNIEVVVSITQWSKVRAGVKGKTLAYVPVIIDKIFDPYDKGADVDVDLAGQIMLSIRGGVDLQLEILGWEVVGADALAGFLMTCTAAHNNMLDLEIFFVIDITATLCDETVNIWNFRTSLYRIQKPDTKGYRILLYEACAYRDTIWGHIAKWTGPREDQGVENFVGQVYITIRRTAYDYPEKTFVVNSDENGYFVLNLADEKFDLIKGDLLWVSRVRNNSYDDTLGEAAIEATFPFKIVTMDYADNFEDVAKGYVNKARVRKWPSDKYEEITYEGPVRLIVKYKQAGDSNFPVITICNDKGEFTLKYDFKPYHKASAILESDGFEVEAWNEVETTVDFIGKRIVETMDITQYINSEGKPVDQRRDIEYFLIINRRGSKQVSAPGHYNVLYSLFSKATFLYDFDGRPISPPKEVGKDGFDQRIIPYGNNNGTSIIMRGFLTEWEWNKPARQLQIINNRIQFIDSSTLQLDEGPILTQLPGAELHPEIEFSYSSGAVRPSDDWVELDDFVGLNSLVRRGYVTFTHEGKVIVVRDPADEDPHGKGRKMLHINDPIAELFIMKIWSRINPANFRSFMNMMKNRNAFEQQLPGADQMNPVEF